MSLQLHQLVGHFAQPVDCLAELVPGAPDVVLAVRGRRLQYVDHFGGDVPVGDQQIHITECEPQVDDQALNSLLLFKKPTQVV